MQQLPPLAVIFFGSAAMVEVICSLLCGMAAVERRMRNLRKGWQVFSCVGLLLNSALFITIIALHAVK